MMFRQVPESRIAQHRNMILFRQVPELRKTKQTKLIVRRVMVMGVQAANSKDKIIADRIQ